MLNQKIKEDRWGIPTKNRKFVFPFNETIGQPIPYPHNKKFAICMTHDVDIPFKGYNIPWTSFKRISSYDHVTNAERIELFFNLCKYKARKKIFRNYIITDPNFCFDEWINYEKSIGVKSCFYVAAIASWDKTGTPADVKYECEQHEIATILPEIVSKGWEVGLHASINAGRKYDTFKQEKEKLENVVGSKICGMRQHFWSPGTPEMMQMIERAGFLYDSSLGLNDMTGFRCGRCTPFIPPGCTALLEIPPTAMDGSVKTVEDLTSHIELCRAYNGVAVLNWHLEQWNPSNLNAVGLTMIAAIDEIRSVYGKEIWWCTPSELAMWWKEAMQ